MTPRIESRREGRANVVSVFGPGRLGDDPALRVRLVDMVSEARFTVLDLTGTQPLERDDLGVLVSARAAHRLRWGNHAHGLKLVANRLVVLCRPVVVELEDVIQAYDTVRDALSAFPSRRVLHVEPDAGAASQVASLLEGRGWDVQRVAVPEDLPPRSEAGDPDLLLTEIEHEGELDLDLVRRLRVEYGVPVAVVTRAEVRSVDGAAAVLRRPFTPEALVDAVERAAQSPLREYYHAVLDGLREAVLIAGGGGEPLFANRAWQGRFGAEGHPVPPALVEPILDVARYGGRRRIELEKPAGAAVSLDGLALAGRAPDVLVLEEGGAAAGAPEPERSEIFLSLIEDLDGMARQLEAANRRLCDLDQLKSEFVATVSHELKTPITSILGSVENLLDGLHGDLSSDQRQALEVVKRSGDRLARLILNLLDLSRIESGELGLRRRPVDLREPIGQACQQLESYRGRSNVHRTLDLPGEPVVAELDPDGLVQVVTNLLDNALRFAASRVRVALTAGVEDAVLVVEDDGPGIPAGAHEAIFERFLGPRVGGECSHMGIGLSIVRGLVEAEGGRVHAENRSREEGGGARFVARFPRARAHVHHREAEAASR